MTFQEALSAQPQWIVAWVYWLGVAGLVLPLMLMIWPQSRVAGIVAALASVAAGMGVTWVFETYGYVKLIGLPHIIFWGPLVWFLLGQQRKEGMPVWPRRIIWVIIVSLSVSLVFDVTDVMRYLLGNRAPAL